MSLYRLLYIWVEGPDDDEFFKSIVLPRLEGYSEPPHILRYAGMTTEYVQRFLSSITSQPHADYIFIADLDNAPCVTSKKDTLVRRFGSLDQERIIVVKKEIEGWYYAGLDAATCVQLGLRHVRDTEGMTKEQFHARRPSQFRSGLVYMGEVLRRYNAETACAQNQSFAYFVKKYGLVR